MRLAAGFPPLNLSSGICDGQSGAGAGFLQVLRFPLSIFIPSSFHFHSIFIKPYIYIVIIQFILTCPISCTMIYSDEINQIKSNQIITTFRIVYHRSDLNVRFLYILCAIFVFVDNCIVASCFLHCCDSSHIHGGVTS
jgi:hypothetical protein